MRCPRPSFLASTILIFTLAVCASGDEYTHIAVTPEQVVLEGKDSSIQLLVTGYDQEGRPTDLTHAVKYDWNSGHFGVSVVGVIRSKSVVQGHLSV